MIVSEIKSYVEHLDYQANDRNNLAKLLFAAFVSGITDLGEVFLGNADRFQAPGIAGDAFYVLYSKASRPHSGFARIENLSTKEVLSVHWNFDPTLDLKIEARLTNPSYSTIKRLGRDIGKMRVMVQREHPPYMTGEEFRYTWR